MGRRIKGRSTANSCCSCLLHALLSGAMRWFHPHHGYKGISLIWGLSRKLLYLQGNPGLRPKDLVNEFINPLTPRTE